MLESFPKCTIFIVCLAQVTLFFAYCTAVSRRPVRKRDNEMRAIVIFMEQVVILLQKVLVSTNRQEALFISLQTVFFFIRLLCQLCDAVHSVWQSDSVRCIPQKFYKLYAKQKLVCFLIDKHNF